MAGSREILVTGASGLVGSRFVELSKYHDQLILPDEKELDITDAGLTRKYLAQVKPEVVINLAAYTNVTEAENRRFVNRHFTRLARSRFERSNASIIEITTLP